MRIAVVGTGYVGLVTGTCLADSGNDVTCIDVDREKIERLARGEVPIFEPGLAEFVERNLEAGRLKFMTDLASAVRSSRLVVSRGRDSACGRRFGRPVDTMDRRRPDRSPSPAARDRDHQEHGARRHLRANPRAAQGVNRPR